jgi:membrane protein implicated in regulation of membrane protease activity
VDIPTARNEASVFFVLTLILALIFLPWPWNFVVIGAAAIFEAVLATAGVRYTRRGRSTVGAQTMIGANAEVITPLEPTGQVRINGEIWEAHADNIAQAGVGVGETVRIRSIEGLTLEVEPAPAQQP